MPCLIIVIAYGIWFLTDRSLAGAIIGITVAAILWVIWWRVISGTWNIFK